MYFELSSLDLLQSPISQGLITMKYNPEFEIFGRDSSDVIAAISIWTAVSTCQPCINTVNLRQASVRYINCEKMSLMNSKHVILPSTVEGFNLKTTSVPL